MEAAMYALNVPEAERERRRSDVTTSIFGPNGQRVLALITGIPALSADRVDQVTRTWKQGNPDDRASAWGQLNGTTTEEERYEILAAAALARREALETSRRLRRADWAFWAAACDASAAVAVGERIGRHYDILVAPFAEVVPSLVAPFAEIMASLAA
jgi:hypothetical protein